MNQSLVVSGESGAGKVSGGHGSVRFRYNGVKGKTKMQKAFV